MMTALSTAPSAYGLKGPSADVTVDNATPQGSTYLRGNSVQSNGTGSETLASKIMKAQWDNVPKAFLDLRGIALQEFDSYPVLDLLHLTGNACRHGDGKSAKILFERCPDWWPHWAKLSINPDGSHSGVPPFSSIAIPETALYQFAEAIIWFWDDAEYIYLNSLKSQHPSVLQTIDALRTKQQQRYSA